MTKQAYVVFETLCTSLSGSPKLLRDLLIGQAQATQERNGFEFAFRYALRFAFRPAFFKHVFVKLRLSQEFFPYSQPGFDLFSRKFGKLATDDLFYQTPSLAFCAIFRAASPAVRSGFATASVSGNSSKYTRFARSNESKS